MTELARAWSDPTFRQPVATPRVLQTSIRWLVDEASVRPGDAARACRRRALLLWPRLDRSRLARTRGDPWRIARLVAERTPRPLDEIVGMLTSATPACPVAPTRSRRPAMAVARISPPR